ncbi:MFS transporter [Methylocapsa palsarum]|nr:MFS transporter [Methylocapsa palsarum]
MMRLYALDWVNFFLADVRGGLGAFVIVFLTSKAHWSASEIGIVLSISGVVGIMALPFVGAFIDHTRAKRTLVAAGAFLLSFCGLAIVWRPDVPVVLAADVVMAILGGVFAPTVAAITVGLCSREGLAARLGRNAAFDRAGNIFIAALIGLLGISAMQEAPFYITPLFAILTAIAVFSIPAGAVDHLKARGSEADQPIAASISWFSLLRYRPFLLFTVASAMFHFANAPVLPLMLQKLTLANSGLGTEITSLALIITQATTIMMALIVTRANELGRKPLLIAAFAAVPLRGILCATFDQPAFLLATQVLDGVGGGLLDILVPLVLADIMRGAGHYSLARGVLGAIQGLGGSLSQSFAGAIASFAGYNAAFLTTALISLFALFFVMFALPETRQIAPFFLREPSPAKSRKGTTFQG